MPPSDAGGAVPAAAQARRAGPTRATPILLLALAGALLVARVALGVYEAVRPAQPLEGVEGRSPSGGAGAIRDSTFGAPDRGP